MRHTPAPFVRAEHAVTGGNLPPAAGTTDGRGVNPGVPSAKPLQPGTTPRGVRDETVRHLVHHAGFHWELPRGPLLRAQRDPHLRYDVLRLPPRLHQGWPGESVDHPDAVASGRCRSLRNWTANRLVGDPLEPTVPWVRPKWGDSGGCSSAPVTRAACSRQDSTGVFQHRRPFSFRTDRTGGLTDLSSIQLSIFSPSHKHAIAGNHQSSVQRNAYRNR